MRKPIRGRTSKPSFPPDAERTFGSGAGREGIMYNMPVPDHHSVVGRQADILQKYTQAGWAGRKHRDQIPEDDPAQPREGRAGILRRGLLLAGLRADRRARRREHGRPDGYRAGAGRDHALPPFDRRGNTRHDVGRRHDGRDGIQHLRRLPGSRSSRWRRTTWCTPTATLRSRWPIRPGRWRSSSSCGRMPTRDCRTSRAKATSRSSSPRTFTTSTRSTSTAAARSRRTSMP